MHLIAAALGFVAAASATALLLPWHHLQVPAHLYYGPVTMVTVTGFDTDSWLIAVAVVALELALRTWRSAPGTGVRWVVTTMAGVMVSGMSIDYVDWSLRGVSRLVHAYYGPGFFVALAAAAASVAAVVRVWRVPV